MRLHNVIVVKSSDDSGYTYPHIWYYEYEEEASGSPSITLFTRGSWDGRGARTKSRDFPAPSWARRRDQFWWKGIKMITLPNGKRFFV